MEASIQTYFQNIYKKKISDNSFLPDVIVKSMECIGYCILWDGVKSLLCARDFSFKPPKLYETSSCPSLGSQIRPLDERRGKGRVRAWLPGEVPPWAGDPGEFRGIKFVLI